MSEELLKRLQSRRSFLKGSALLAASAMAIPTALSAQQTQDPPTQDAKDKPNDGQGQQQKQDEDKDKDKDKSKDSSQQQAKEGDGEQTFIDADGRPYRVCPQCGSNMYKQDRTWTCENCGYSYVE